MKVPTKIQCRELVAITVHSEHENITVKHKKLAKTESGENASK